MTPPCACVAVDLLRWDYYFSKKCCSMFPCPSIHSGVSLNTFRLHGEMNGLCGVLNINNVSCAVRFPHAYYFIVETVTSLLTGLSIVESLHCCYRCCRVSVALHLGHRLLYQTVGECEFSPPIFPSTSIELRSREGFLIRSGDKAFSFSGVRMTLTNRQPLDRPGSVRPE